MKWLNHHTFTDDIADYFSKVLFEEYNIIPEIKIDKTPGKSNYRNTLEGLFDNIHDMSINDKVYITIPNYFGIKIRLSYKYRIKLIEAINEENILNLSYKKRYLKTIIDISPYLTNGYNKKYDSSYHDKLMSKIETGSTDIQYTDFKSYTDNLRDFCRILKIIER